MVLDTNLSQFDSKLVRRLISANLLVFILVLVVFSGCVYGYSNHAAYEDVERDLSLLCGSLISSIDPGENEPDLLSATRSEPTTLPLNILCVQWYSPDGKLLYSLGGLRLVIPFDKDSAYTTQKSPAALVLSRPANLRGRLYGYVRVGQSLSDFTEEQERLGGGLAVGVVASLIVSGFGIFWLTRQSVQQIEHSFFRLKTFTDDASHEFGTPLMAMKSNLSLVLRRSTNLIQEDRERLVIVDQAIDDLSHLADDLLHLAREDNSQTQHRSALVALRSVVEKSLDRLQPLARERRINVSSLCPPELYVKGNPDELQRLVTNLVHNALRYSHENGEVDVSAEASGNNIEIKVKDNGIGIAASDLPLLFERFWRADRARTHRTGGSGLGLSIAQSIVRAHGGEITVTSQLNQGSCFTVRLPAAEEPVS